ncbi:alpha/beta hydrolase [bacterium]|nr:alpha/beta hydrolase [bacterium]
MMLARNEHLICSVELGGQPVDISISRTRRGDTPVMLLHGIQTNKDVFADWHQSSIGEDCDFIAIDLPGFGRSGKPGQLSYSIDTFATAVLAVADNLGLSKFHVVGHSLGGMVGTTIISRPGNRILSLASLEGNLIASDCGTSATLADCDRNVFRKSGYQELRESIRDSTSPSSALRLAALELTPADIFLSTAQDIVRVSDTSDLEKVFLQSSVPKLMVVGGESGFHSRPSSDACKTVEIPETSHFMLLDNPTTTMTAVADFWAEIWQQK